MGTRITIRLDNLQAYKVTLIWKVYLFSSTQYSLTLTNTLATTNLTLNCSQTLASCP